VSASTVHADLHDTECLVTLIADTFVEFKVDTPSADSSFAAEMFARVLLIIVMVAGVEELPIDQVVAALETPRQHHVALTVPISD